ncbi:MAG: tetratricopeptide repeat protein [Planctomycetes bacterium]|nr:tetratricopeptide repeat protein [Planctomycetota bacterium]
MYLAAGELALEKHDDAIAAQSFEEGLKRFPDDPDMQFGLARAYANSDSKRTIESVQAVLRINPLHLSALLFLADHAIDSERYAEAEEVLGRVLDVDPWQPEAWAYRAVLAHLMGDRACEAEHRATALKFWPTNPAVDHLIGRKLSQNYRFTEGPKGLRTSGGHLSSMPNTCPPRSSSSRTCCGSATTMAGRSPTRYTRATATTSRPTTWSRSATTSPTTGCCATSSSSSAWSRVRPSCTATACCDCCTGPATRSAASMGWS